ncbi:MAG TPA: chemotaxis protein CheW [Phycisphaerae bacterium]|jgi:purine-binding chemotaxis protein CheW|nr:chemotaxis protein CheW [Phycisphaerae bacterium]
MTPAPATAVPTAPRLSTARGGKYLTFALGKEEYGLEILKVREIIGYMEITSVPSMPAHVKGVINLRGQVISVVDLRTRFGMAATERSEQNCIIVVEVAANSRKFHCGVIVDRVSEVLNIAEDLIEDPPSLGASVNTDFIVGMGKVGDAVKILLNLDRVLAEHLPESAAQPAAASN